MPVCREHGLGDWAVKQNAEFEQRQALADAEANPGLQFTSSVAKQPPSGPDAATAALEKALRKLDEYSQETEVKSKHRSRLQQAVDRMHSFAMSWGDEDGGMTAEVAQMLRPLPGRPTFPAESAWKYLTTGQKGIQGLAELESVVKNMHGKVQVGRQLCFQFLYASPDQSSSKLVQILVQKGGSRAQQFELQQPVSHTLKQGGHRANGGTDGSSLPPPAAPTRAVQQDRPPGSTRAQQGELMWRWLENLMAELQNSQSKRLEVRFW